LKESGNKSKCVQQTWRQTEIYDTVSIEQEKGLKSKTSVNSPKENMKEEKMKQCTKKKRLRHDKNRNQ
jgi:hypothetical protein